MTLLEWNKSSFIFTVCQVGAEKALKNELSLNHPEFHVAFSRPGFLTFKNSNGVVLPSFKLNSVFARTYGVSVGTFDFSNRIQVLELLKALMHENEANQSHKIHLHVWERDLHTPGEEPLGYVPGSLIGTLRDDIRNDFQIGLGVSADELLQKSGVETNQAGEVKPGDSVIHVIVIDPGKFALGYSSFGPSCSRWPGGRPALQLLEEAPSRAYLKLEEVLLWSQASVKARDVAVEIGSSPGGASFALLQRGLRVIGIDPAAMDPQILEHPAFSHIQRPVAQVLREELPERVDWLLLDMNVEPRISLYAVDRLASRMMNSLCGVFLTIKLNQWKMAEEIPSMLEHVRAMGFGQVRVAQLSYHRQEVVIFGLTRKGMVRRG